MSIDLSRVTGISDSRGVITEIKDSLGRVIWAVPDTGEPAVLGVKKITSDTYAGETTYTGEQFILLDIYPKTNGTVKVTYGGLTKTVTDVSGVDQPSAKQVYFGTFNGVTDGVATPASGELTIKGDYAGFAISKYNTAKITTAYCTCITAILNFGVSQLVADYAFKDCVDITSASVSEGVTVIGSYAFHNCAGLSDLTLPSSLTTINNYAFGGCTGLVNITIPGNVNFVGDGAFAYGTNKTIRMLSVTPPRIDSINAFGVNRYVTFIVPAGCGNAYKNASGGWSQYKDCIVEGS